MADQPPANENQSPDTDDFARQAQQQQLGLLREFVEFLGENKKWWLLPIILVLLVFGLLFVLSPSVAPFIYTLF